MTSTIQLTARDGSVIPNVKAEVFGFFAVHEAVDGKGPVTLTHIPTGLAIAKGLTYVQAVSAVVRLSHIDWNFRLKAAAQSLKPAVQKILEEVKGVCHEKTAASA